jgi:hypothetical protein
MAAETEQGRKETSAGLAGAKHYQHLGYLTLPILTNCKSVIPPPSSALQLFNKAHH